MSTLDPSSPLVLDARTLGRRAGSMKKLDFSVAAPADLGVGLIAVPPGSEIEFDIRLEAVIDGVLVTGSAGMFAVLGAIVFRYGSRPARTF